LRRGLRQAVEQRAGASALARLERRGGRAALLLQVDVEIEVPPDGRQVRGPELGALQRAAGRLDAAGDLGDRADGVSDPPLLLERPRADVEGALLRGGIGDRAAE